MYEGGLSPPSLLLCCRKRQHYGSFHSGYSLTALLPPPQREHTSRRFTVPPHKTSFSCFQGSEPCLRTCHIPTFIAGAGWCCLPIPACWSLPPDGDRGAWDGWTFCAHQNTLYWYTAMKLSSCKKRIIPLYLYTVTFSGIYSLFFQNSE